MLPALILGELATRGIGNVSLETIHPQSDETGKMEDGGWLRVKSWCKANGGANIQTFFEPLFADQPGLDAIVFHVDGDSLLDVCRASKIEQPKLPVSAKARVAHIVDVVHEWLAVSDKYRSKVVLAIPVQSTEAWILAAEASYHDLEDIDAKREFLRTFSRGINLEKFYKHRADAARDKTSKIAEQSQSFTLFRNAMLETLGAETAP
ncbi:hypothetical protein ACFWXH_30875 [Mesorhizobium sp. NPDC059054]|uniref:hypothetical protein n=1 Tax=Mesorhizobium sp. NPDC059054 TaxID=3346711 RepID=UPI0036AFE892